MKGGEYSFARDEDESSILLYFYQSGFYAGKIKAESEPHVPLVQDYYRFYNREVVNTVQRTWLVRKPALEAIYIQPANLGRMLLRFSPVGLYDAATEAWAGTDLEGIQDFFNAVRRYRQAVLDYFDDEKIFGSRQWFAADQGTADWDALPQFSFQRSGTDINAKRAFPDLFLLLMINLILFTIIFLILSGVKCRMIWHITKREIYDNLNSLRFALATVLLLALMVTNAVRHLREHPKRVQRYQGAVTESLIT